VIHRERSCGCISLASDRTARTGFRLDLALCDFHSTIDELLEYLLEVGPFVEKLDTAPRWDRSVDDAVSGRPEKKAAAFREFMPFTREAR
jgi:hypothetical protein